MPSRIPTLRWHVARFLIHTALKIAPPGRARQELTNTLWVWGLGVIATVTAQHAMNNRGD